MLLAPDRGRGGERGQRVMPEIVGTQESSGVKCPGGEIAGTPPSPRLSP
jgi:hypothetical protein